MHHDYWSTFAELILTPFRQVPLIWGIVPLYFALLLGELTSAKANFRTAVQTGFSFLWAGAQWLYLYQKALVGAGSSASLKSPPPITGTPGNCMLDIPMSQVYNVARSSEAVLPGVGGSR